MQLSSTDIVSQTDIILLFAKNDFCTIFRKAAADLQNFILTIFKIPFCNLKFIWVR